MIAMGHKRLKTSDGAGSVRVVTLISTCFAIIILAVLWNSAAKRSALPATVDQQDKRPTSDLTLYKFLPTGARIEDETKDIASADLDGDGQFEKIIFYSVSNPNPPSAGIMVLKSTTRDYIPFWEKTYKDSTGFGYPSGIFNLGNEGNPQIFAYRRIGTSCPGILDVFEVRQGIVEQITGPWADKGTCQTVDIKDIRNNGKLELVVGTRENGTDIYGWNGRQYTRLNGSFPEYYDEQLAQLLGDINSVKTLPISARLTWTRQAVRIYTIQRRYSDAIQLLHAVLIMINNPSLTKSNSTVPDGAPADQQKRLTAWFEIEKLEASAAIHYLLADTYKSTKNLRDAENEFRQGEALKLQTTQERNKF